MCFLINFYSKVNGITTEFPAKLKFTARTTNVGAKKIDESPLETYGIISAEFLFQNSLIKSGFLRIFFFTDINMNVILTMLF